jgi:hypothetical protein
MKTAKVPGLDVPWQLQKLTDAVIEQPFAAVGKGGFGL